MGMKVRICPVDTILAANTSALSIDEMSSVANVLILETVLTNGYCVTRPYSQRNHNRD